VDAAAEQVGKTTLLGRQASSREIAEVILVLGPDHSSYVTGATIAVDTGRTAI
jgi:NAD(P)-dependent dehydrogenase (short-subunit alcohol dehydrogenase family)